MQHTAAAPLPRRRSAHLAIVALATVVTTVAVAAPAFAHAGHDRTVLSGLAHPFLGVDHVLAMTAVGALAFVQRRLLALPATFLAAMTVGSVVGLTGGPAPGTEVAVAASVALLGVALLAGRAARPTATFLAVGAAGLAHGHVHGAAATGAGSGLGFLAAVLAASAALHALGALGGAALGERPARRETCALALIGAGVGITATLL